MKCPSCNNENICTIDTRDSGNSKRRRRKCKDCGRRFTTYENVYSEEKKISAFEQILILEEKIKSQNISDDTLEQLKTLNPRTYLIYLLFSKIKIGKIALAKMVEIVDCELKKQLASKRIPFKTGQRYDIMKRDKFKCVLCGRNPKDDDSVILHVDHIIPVSKNGTNDNSNLRTLCRECNTGKSNKIE